MPERSEAAQSERQSCPDCGRDHAWADPTDDCKPEDVERYQRGGPVMACFRAARDVTPTGTAHMSTHFLAAFLTALEKRGWTVSPLIATLSPLPVAAKAPDDCSCGPSRSNEYKGRDGWWRCFECDGRVEKVEE